MNLKTEYVIDEEFNSTEIKITCGSKMLLQKLFETYNPTVTNLNDFVKFSSAIELTVAEKELINFDNTKGSYNIQLDNDPSNIEKFEPVFFSEAIVTVLLERIKGMSIPSTYLVNLGFLTELVESGAISYSELELYDEDVLVDITTEGREFEEVTDATNFDKLQMSNTIINNLQVLTKDQESVDYNTIVVINHITKLVFDLVDGDVKSKNMIYFLFDMLFDVNAGLLTVKDISVIKKYLNYEFK